MAEMRRTDCLNVQPLQQPQTPTNESICNAQPLPANGPHPPSLSATHCTTEDGENSELFLTPINNGKQRNHVSTPVQINNKLSPITNKKPTLNNMEAGIALNSCSSSSPDMASSQTQPGPPPKSLQRSEADVATEKMLKIREKHPTLNIKIIKNKDSLTVDHTNWLNLAMNGSIDFKSEPALTKEECILFLNEDIMARTLAISTAAAIIPGSSTPAVTPKNINPEGRITRAGMATRAYRKKQNKT